MGKIFIKRVYEEASAGDGYRILVDRIWPRGVTKKDARLDDWRKELGPSNELRMWFDHDPQRFAEFKKKYIMELDGSKEGLAEIRKLANDRTITLLYGAKDKQHNQAVVLQKVLQSM